MDLDQQSAFQNKIEELAQEKTDLHQDKEQIDNCVKFFCDVYSSPNFRHQYSDITRCIYGDMTPQNIEEFNKISKRSDRLVNNLGVLESFIEAECNYLNDETACCVKSKYAKLYDHVCLEHERLLLFESPYYFKDQFGSEIKKLNGDLNATKDESAEISEKLQDSQKDYIAILAIFAAVILAFSGGFGFLSESFANISNSQIENLICMVSLVGITLIDLLYILLRFVWSIIRYKRDQKSIPHIKLALILFNLLFLLIFVASFCLSIGILHI